MFTMLAPSFNFGNPLLMGIGTASGHEVTRLRPSPRFGLAGEENKRDENRHKRKYQLGLLCVKRRRRSHDIGFLPDLGQNNPKDCAKRQSCRNH
ncbi:hypothetical protein ELI43_37675 [Rhizobium leguminosarum]|uniref:hypothetical protein n=1 Tax=Rhizobium leguminosarum TaxID=384 RepID=UPI0010325B80|nr:hypothetical protein [Rhizobium leguminosarum]TAU34881.1 hypothetical protein ELI43_37675 [Rhizobium leguminosarum]